MQRFVPIEDVFKGRHFDRQIIVLCVSWYTSFKLSLRDLVIMARPVDGSWKRDQTYIKVHG
jgi:transposase-like protein